MLVVNVKCREAEMLSQVFLRAQYSAFDEYLLTVLCALPTATPCTRGGACVSRHALAYTVLILMWGIQSCPTPGACLLCLHFCAISHLHVSVNLYVTAICSAWFPSLVCISGLILHTGCLYVTSIPAWSLDGIYRHVVKSMQWNPRNIEK